MNLTAENTAVVIDSTADFPDAEQRFPNFRVVPLYVRFGEESFRDYVDMSPSAVLRAAGEREGDADDVAADARRLPRRLRRARAQVRADPLDPALLDPVGDVRERGGRSRAPGRRHRARDRLGHRLGRAGDARARRSAPPRARDDRRGDRCARRPLQGRPPPALHGQHARVPGARRPHRPRGRARREPAEREADPHDPRRRGRAAEARARQREGVRGVPRAVRGDVDRLAAPEGRDRACRGPRPAAGARGARRPRPAAGRDRDRNHARRRSRHPRRARDGRASSGTRTTSFKRPSGSRRSAARRARSSSRRSHPS